MGGGGRRSGLLEVESGYNCSNTTLSEGTAIPPGGADLHCWEGLCLTSDNQVGGGVGVLSMRPSCTTTSR